MAVVNDLFHWTNLVLWWGLVALKAWAFVDCATRKAAAFPAVDKLTKPAWLTILALAGLLGTWLSPSPIGPLSLIATIVALVYLADVRPAVREITGRS